MRYLQTQIEKDLGEKMVFLGGPRQVGKTTLAQTISPDPERYFNWDIPHHREKILKRELPPTKGVLVFDEIHKYRSWRNYLKGLYDEKKNFYRILATGSARLDYYRFGGDSLQGRYHYLRLHPLSVAELKLKTIGEVEMLCHLGGFPEPYFSQSEKTARRWSTEYRSRLIREEIIDLENIHDIGNLELLMLRLPDLVGSPLSINALREDLQLNHKTVSRWLDILERFYALFRLSPFAGPKIKAVKKEQKHYHYDWSLVEEESFRFENMVASHLLKWVHFMIDTEALDVELRYFRDVTRREVDFVLCEKRKPLLFIECKLGDAPVDPSLIYLKKKYPSAEAFQISLRGKKDYLSRDDIRVCPALPFLAERV